MELKDCFANSLKSIYVNSQKSLTEFADELAISRSSLQKILSGNCNPRMDTVQHIANRLNVDPLSLLVFDKDVDDTGKLFVARCPIHTFISRSLLALSKAERAKIRAYFYKIISILAHNNISVKKWSREISSADKEE